MCTALIFIKVQLRWRLEKIRRLLACDWNVIQPYAALRIETSASTFHIVPLMKNWGAAFNMPRTGHACLHQMIVDGISCGWEQGRMIAMQSVEETDRTCRGKL